MHNATEPLAGVRVMARGADGKKWFMQPLMAASKIPAAKLTIRARKNSLINFRSFFGSFPSPRRLRGQRDRDVKSSENFEN